MAEQDDEPQLVEISNLTDADWAEINKLRQEYARGGRDGFEKAFDDLYKRNDIHWMKIAYAYYPTTVREALKRDKAAPAKDLREIISKLKDTKQ